MSNKECRKLICRFVLDLCASCVILLAFMATSASSLGKPVIRLLLADDHPVVRKGLRSCFADYPHFTVIGEAEDGQQAVQLAKTARPDVAILDIRMPILDGVGATRLIRRDAPRTRVLILSISDDRNYILQAVRAGAHGYVLKDVQPQVLAQAIETVHAGCPFFSPAIAQQVLEEWVAAGGRVPSAEQPALAARERAVLALVAQGKGNKDIARQLGIGVRTVETYRRRIMKKLDIHCVAGLTQYALTHDLVPKA